MSLWGMTLFAQSMPLLNPESCTSIMVGRMASTDGSVIQIIHVTVGIAHG